MKKLVVLLALVAGTAHAQSPGTPLELLSFRCEKQHSYVFVRGEVRNVSNQPIEHLMAVGVFRAEDGTLIKSGDSLVEYDPLMPGQASPFSVGETDNPLIKRCEIAFKTMWGSRVAYTSKPKQPKPQEATGQPRVKKAQEWLTALGYDPGPIDGVMGTRTKAALEQFARDQNLDTSEGLLSSDIYGALAARRTEVRYREGPDARCRVVNGETLCAEDDESFEALLRKVEQLDRRQRQN